MGFVNENERRFYWNRCDLNRMFANLFATIVKKGPASIEFEDSSGEKRKQDLSLVFGDKLFVSATAQSEKRSDMGVL